MLLDMGQSAAAHERAESIWVHIALPTRIEHGVNVPELVHLRRNRGLEGLSVAGRRTAVNQSGVLLKRESWG